MATPFQPPAPITTSNTPGTNAPPKLPMRPDVPISENPHNSDVIRTYTLRDVLNGRGQGVQRHPGNVKYRTLVFVNKTLYAKCPRNDKIKISRGIVAAVRKSGGRFLDLDERTNIYTDIGDKKATEKTSQALREGQTKIRQDAYQNKDTGKQPMLPAPPVNADGMLEISGEGYMEYSVKVLGELYNAEDNMTPEMAMRPAPHSVATQLGLGVPKRKEHKHKGVRIVSSDAMPVLPPIVSAPGVSSADLAAVYCQQQQQQHQQAATHPHMPPPDLPSTMASSSDTPMGDTSQLTNISRLPLSELLRLSANGERGASGSVTAQIMELVRQSQSELMQTDLAGRFGNEILPSNGTGQNTESSTSTNSGPMQRDTAVHQGQRQESAKRSHDEMSAKPVDKDAANDVAEMLLALSRDSDKKLDVTEI
mmetsp:Transcript_21963/g.35929  ORF Transcript_21963/g.35929 Transcript_21963/m.35929 type:complete len:422 (-) Transcript_21963:103-1368(-)